MSPAGNIVLANMDSFALATRTLRHSLSKAAASAKAFRVCSGNSLSRARRSSTLDGMMKQPQSHGNGRGWRGRSVSLAEETRVDLRGVGFIGHGGAVVMRQ